MAWTTFCGSAPAFWARISNSPRATICAANHDLIGRFGDLTGSGIADMRDGFTHRFEDG